MTSIRAARHAIIIGETPIAQKQLVVRCFPLMAGPVYGLRSGRRMSMAKYVDDFDLILRPLAYACMLLVVGVTKVLGGSWVAFALGIMVVGAASLLLPTDKPQDSYRIIALTWLRTIRSWRWPYRVACSVVLAGCVTAVDAHVGGANLGRGFNVSLIPVFFSSLFFGASVTFVTSVLVLLAVDYFVIPPQNSFAIVSFQDAADLLIFVILTWVVSMAPQMLYKSSILDEGRWKRLRRAQF